MTPREALRRMLIELPDIRASLVTRAQWPAVRTLDDWRRMMEHALGQRGTGELPAAESDPR